MLFLSLHSAHKDQSPAVERLYIHISFISSISKVQYTQSTLYRHSGMHMHHIHVKARICMALRKQGSKSELYRVHTVNID